MNKEKIIFEKRLVNFTKKLNNYISTKDGQWSIKGFIDSYKSYRRYKKWSWNV
jgi:hypothetical protein